MKHFHNRILKETADGSHTLFLPEYNEHYHSVHGALSESVHVFIKEGFDVAVKSFAGGSKDDRKVFSILEVGFGTGLNALLTLERSLSLSIQVHYLALEPYPLTAGEVSRLNLADKVAGGKLATAFFNMHNTPFGETTEISPEFIFDKWQLPLSDAPLPPDTFRLVYHDAFAPQLQPDLWSKEVFAKLERAMAAGGVLATYCAKGSVKRALKECGFSLTHPAGPKGKREMTRAEKKTNPDPGIAGPVEK